MDPLTKSIPQSASNQSLRERLRSLVTRLLKSSIGRDTMQSMGLKLASVGLTFLTTVLLARWLGPSDYGVYAYAYALISLVSIPSEFGLPTLVVRETARGVAREEYGVVQGIWRWATQVTGVISIGLVCVTGVALWLFRASLEGSKLATFLWALALVPLIALGDLRGAALRGLQRVVTGQLPEFLLRPGLLVILLTGAALLQSSTLTAPQAMALYVGASALAFIAGTLLLWRATPIVIRKALPRIEHRTWLLSALPLAFIAGMQVIDQQAAILLQGFFLPDAKIGIYRVASQVSVLASFALVVINTVVGPRFAALYARHEMLKLQRLVKASAQVTMLLNLALTVGFIFLGRYFLVLAFGRVYEGAYIPLMIMLVGQLVNSATGSVGVLLNMSGHEQETAKGIALAALLNVILNLILIPVWGINGSAVGTSASLIVWNVMLWWAVRKKLRINSLIVG